MNWLTTALVALLAVALVAMACLIARVAVYFKGLDDERHDAFEVLRGDGSAREKAESFVALMAFGVVGVHTIANKGETYSDARQNEMFKAGLTDARMKALLSITGGPR